MVKAMGLIFSLLDIASAQEVPFGILQHSSWTYITAQILLRTRVKKQCVLQAQ